MKGSDRIVSIFYIKETFSHTEHNHFVLGNQSLMILKILRKKLRTLMFPKNSVKESISNDTQEGILL